jgi:hypothetical protein
MTTTFPLTAPIKLVGRIGRGSFTVRAQDGLTEAAVDLAALHAKSDIVDRTMVELRGDTLMIATPRQGGIFDLPIFGGRADERDAIDIAVTVPTGTDVRITAYTADITVVGRIGSAHLAYGSSQVCVDTVQGDLTLRFGSGQAEIERVRGRAQIRSGAGTVRIGEVSGALSSGCGSGNLSVGSARGPVHSRAGSGSATLGAVYGDVDLASGSGSMTIGVPSGVSARLDVISGSGDIGSELPVDQVPEPSRPKITVRARTGSGPVRIVSAA